MLVANITRNQNLLLLLPSVASIFKIRFWEGVDSCICVVCGCGSWVGWYFAGGGGGGVEGSAPRSVACMVVLLPWYVT